MRQTRHATMRQIWTFGMDVELPQLELKFKLSHFSRFAFFA